jgi:hypothetical protein
MLLVKVVVAFKRVLLTEFGGALVLRLITKNTYQAVDLGLEGCLIALPAARLGSCSSTEAVIHLLSL